jgi:uncharacterized protein YgiM (DUF1202 family)
MGYLVIRYALIATILAAFGEGIRHTADAVVYIPAARAYRVQGEELGVTTRRLSIRSRPSGNGRILGTTSRADTVTVLNRTPRNGYLHVATSERDTGWVLSRSVQLRSATSKTGSKAAPVSDTITLPTSNGDIGSWEKPMPVEQNGGACAAQGLGKNGKPAPDPQTDLRKNRVDTSSAYHPVGFPRILALPWTGLPRRRTGWHQADSLQVARYEGPPVALEGYLVDAVEEGPESTNCEIDTHAWHDWHMWLVPTPTEAASRDRKRAVVVEVTPRVRARLTNWTLPSVKALARNGEKVRIAGWLMWDPDHPDQVGKTRGTTWEIHPVTRIEVLHGGIWMDIANQ